MPRPFWLGQRSSSAFKILSPVPAVSPASHTLASNASSPYGIWYTSTVVHSHCIMTGVRVIGALTFISVGGAYTSCAASIHFVFIIGFPLGCRLLIVYPGSHF